LSLFVCVWNLIYPCSWCETYSNGRRRHWEWKWNLITIYVCIHLYIYIYVGILVLVSSTLKQKRSVIPTWFVFPRKWGSMCGILQKICNYLVVANANEEYTFLLRVFTHIFTITTNGKWIMWRGDCYLSLSLTWNNAYWKQNNMIKFLSKYRSLLTLDNWFYFFFFFVFVLLLLRLLFHLPL